MDLNEFTDYFLNPLMLKLSKENKNVFLMGDFNADLIKANSDTPISHYFDCLTSYLFTPHITLPTRISRNYNNDNSTQTLIDNIFSNSLNPMDGISGNLTLAISDHLAQFLIIPSHTNKQVHNFEVYKRNTKNFDRENFVLDLLEIKWKDVIQIRRKDPNFSFHEFETKLFSIIDKYMPLRKLSKKEIKQQSKPWITAGIRNSIKRRDKMYKKYIKANNLETNENYFNSYKELRNHIVDLCRNSKTLYYRNYFRENSNNLRKSWQGIKSVINIKHSQKNEPSSLLIDDKLITEPKQIANEFNKYFSTIANKLRDEIHTSNLDFKNYLSHRNVNSMYLNPTNEIEVYKLISKLDNEKATGPHGIPTDILKYISPIIAESLSDIINLSFKMGKYIEDLKISKTIPIYKGKGNDLQCSSYRPISLLSNINKIVEKLMYKRTYNFLNRNNCLYRLQFGFRDKHSTTHALTYLTESVRKSLDGGLYACGVFVDLQKAFDTVDHEILLKKLDHYGIRGIENNWYKSYLSNRKQYVFIKGSTSEEVIMQHGVPQGSVLGPLLFLLYINDLNAAISHSETIHFADDTSLVLANKSLKQLEVNMNNDLRNLSDWLKANKISLNADKTELLIFRHPNKKLSDTLELKIDEKYLHPSEYVKYLGLYIDSHLNWKYHIDNLAAKLTRATGMLSKIRHYIPPDLLTSIYYGIFSAHLTYGSQVWCQGNNTNVNRITKLQNRAIRIINRAAFYEPVDILYKNKHILKIKSLIELQNALFVYDSLNNNLPIVFNEMFELVSNTAYRKTRRSHSCKVKIPKFRTATYGSNSIKNQSITMWNKLTDKYPDEPMHEMKRSKFKTTIINSILLSY